jgi:AraC-like DNA-binding protein
MIELPLSIFTKDNDFPFFVNLGAEEKDLYMHLHSDFSELVVVQNGTATHCVGDEQYFVRKGDVFVINRGTGHGYKNTNDFYIYNIMYRPENVIYFDSDIRKLAGFHALFVIEPYLAKSQNFKSRLQLTLDDFEKINNIITNMIDEYNKKENGWKMIVRAYFMLIIVALSRKYSMPEHDTKENIINMAKAVSYMENNYTEHIAIDELAAQMYISERHFSRLFKQTYQITPGNYILNLRMHYACELLKNSQLSIADVAFKSGFGDGNYFARQFGRIFGVTPREYRKRGIEL